jgi:hypothetical protein
MFFIVFDQDRIGFDTGRVNIATRSEILGNSRKPLRDEQALLGQAFLPRKRMNRTDLFLSQRASFKQFIRPELKSLLLEQSKQFGSKLSTKVRQRANP